MQFLPKDDPSFTENWKDVSCPLCKNNIPFVYDDYKKIKVISINGHPVRNYTYIRFSNNTIEIISKIALCKDIQP